MSSASGPRAEVIAAWKIQEYTEVAAFTCVLYYYLITLCDEIRYIWPQPNLKLGKLLYFAARFSFGILFVSRILMLHPTHIKMSVETCNNVLFMGIGISTFMFIVADAILWVCLYALLHAKKRYFAILAFLFFAFHVPNVVFAALSYKVEGLRAITPPAQYSRLGYACFQDWVAQDSTRVKVPVSIMTAVRSYLKLAKVIFTAILAIAVFAVHYRRQRNGLLRVIRREGGFYYLATIVIYTLKVMANSPKPVFEDRYCTTDSALVLTLIFSDRLILRLHRSQDAGTQGLVSTLVFDSGRTSDDSSEDVDGNSEVSSWEGRGPLMKETSRVV